MAIRVLPDPIGRCAMCDGPGPLTNEHVISLHSAERTRTRRPNRCAHRSLGPAAGTRFGLANPRSAARLMSLDPMGAVLGVLGLALVPLAVAATPAGHLTRPSVQTLARRPRWDRGPAMSKTRVTRCRRRTAPPHPTSQQARGEYKNLSAARAAGYVLITTTNYPDVHYLSYGSINRGDLIEFSWLCPRANPATCEGSQPPRSTGSR